MTTFLPSGVINVEAGWGIGGQYGLYGKKLKIGVGDLTVIGAEYGIGGKYGLGVGAGVTLLGHDIKVSLLGYYKLKSCIPNFLKQKLFK